MVEITSNIEDKTYNYKEWHKEVEKLIGTQFDTTAEFENSLSVGHKIHIETKHPVLPDGMTIAKDSTTTINDLRAKTLEVLSVSQVGNSKTINVGIRSTASIDNVL
jgi:hypothetical protein